MFIELAGIYKAKSFIFETINKRNLSRMIPLIHSGSGPGKTLWEPMFLCGEASAFMTQISGLLISSAAYAVEKLLWLDLTQLCEVSNNRNDVPICVC